MFEGEGRREREHSSSSLARVSEDYVFFLFLLDSNLDRLYPSHTPLIPTLAPTLIVIYIYT